MASAAVISGPATLSESHSDISTIDLDSGRADLSQPNVTNHRPATIGLEVRSGRYVRRMDLLVETTPVPAWVYSTLRASARLLLLPFNWDREGAPPIQVSAISSAFKALWRFMEEGSSIPQWTPTREGGVQLDWHENGIDLEIAFDPNGSDGEAVFADHRNPAADWDGFISSKWEELSAVFRDRLNARAER